MKHVCILSDQPVVIHFTGGASLVLLLLVLCIFKHTCISTHTGWMGNYGCFDYYIPHPMYHCKSRILREWIKLKMTRLNCLAKEDIVAGRCCQYLEILATRLKGAFTHTKMNIHNNPTSHTYLILLPTSGLSVGLQFSGTTIGNACGKYVPYFVLARN